MDSIDTKSRLQKNIHNLYDEHTGRPNDLT